MTDRERYTPGPASGARIQKEGEKWVLILVRELRHPPEKVWQALTDAAHLHEWAPFDADGNLDTLGTVKLTWVGTTEALEAKVRRADAPKVLEYNDIRWELEPFGSGTRLTLWHSIDRRFISMGAAGWHIALDVLDRLLASQPIGRMAAGEAIKFDGWQRLNAEYAKQFGIEVPNWVEMSRSVEGPRTDTMRSPSGLIGEKIKDLGDWRGKTLAKIREVIHEADPEIVEEWKWVKPTNPGTPVWSHDGIVCTGETYKSFVKMTFAKGASLEDPSGLFNSSLEGNVRRAIDIHEGDKIDEAALRNLIRAAVALNQQGKSKSKPRRTNNRGS